MEGCATLGTIGWPLGITSHHTRRCRDNLTGGGDCGGHQRSARRLRSVMGESSAWWRSGEASATGDYVGLTASRAEQSGSGALGPTVGKVQGRLR